jgi:hypothetical protein
VVDTAEGLGCAGAGVGTELDCGAAAAVGGLLDDWGAYPPSIQGEESGAEDELVLRQ